MDTVTAAKIKIVKENPLKESCPRNAKANNIKNKTNGGPIFSPEPTNNRTIDIMRQRREAINRIL